MSSFPVLDVTAWEFAGIESDGLNEHPWLREPDAEELWLFKPVTTHDGQLRGEDWAEKIASEVGVRLTVPCATVELAKREGRIGCVSRSVCPRGWELQPGSLLIADSIPDYEPGRKDAAGHSLNNIQACLTGLAAPPGSQVPDHFGTFDVFAGFLVLDALIANRDRHERNWAVLRPPPGNAAQDALCAAYDHASGLGFNLTDKQRRQRLDAHSVESWARRGDAYRFESPGRGRAPSLVDHARHALSLCTPNVSDYWLTMVHALDPQDLGDVVHAVPHLSAVTATFVTEVLTINRRRLLDA